MCASIVIPVSVLVVLLIGLVVLFCWPWPGSWNEVLNPDAVPTIYFRPINENDFNKSQGDFNYKKE